MAIKKAIQTKHNGIENKITISEDPKVLEDIIPTLVSTPVVEHSNLIEINTKLEKELDESKNISIKLDLKIDELNSKIKELENELAKKPVENSNFPPKKFVKGDRVMDNTLPRKLYYITEFYGLHWSGCNMYKLIGVGDDEIIISYEQNLEIK